MIAYLNYYILARGCHLFGLVTSQPVLASLVYLPALLFTFFGINFSFINSGTFFKAGLFSQSVFIKF